MNTFKFWIFLVIFSLAIPIIGIITSTLVSHGYEKDYENIIIDGIKKEKGIDLSNNQDFLAEIKLNNICSQPKIDKDFTSICIEYNQIKFLEYGASYTLLFSILALTIVPLLSLCAKKSRKALFYLFRPGLFLTQIISVILVIANSVIIIFSIYFAESFYVGRVHVYLITILGLGAAYIALRLCIKALTPIKNAEALVLGKSLSKNAYPHIWQFVESIAERVGTNPPNTIIVGMDPNFFVTETKVTCLDCTIKGRSLYLSLPFCRTLTEDELAAIIGHEMGHFVGEDTIWSRKFYPIYRGAAETINTLYSPTSENSDNGLIELALLPAFYYTSFFLSSFEKIEKKFGRERELNADKIGVKITSPQTMAIGLLKAHIYPYAWQLTQQEMHNALAEGKQIINISTFFSSICQSISKDFMKDEIGKSHTFHPTDTHPPLSMRLDSIGVKLSEVYSDGIKLPVDNIAINLIENAAEIEEELSEMEHYKLIRSGAVVSNK